MARQLEQWARVELQFLREELEWLNAGGKVVSPTGDDITALRQENLKARIEHVRLILGSSEA